MNKKVKTGYLGEMGESIFKFWCAQESIVCNPSTEDKTGWDFFIELPEDRERIRFNSSFSPQCFIQVKATSRKVRAVQISLSNLKRMILTPKPSFIVFIVFDVNGNPLEAFIRLVDEILIDKIVNSIESNIDENLHKHKLSVSFSNEHKLDLSRNSFLHTAIRHAIGCSYEEYMHKKMHYVGKLTKEVLTFEVSITGEDNIRKLALSSIGSGEKVPVSVTKAIRTQLGHEDSLDNLEGNVLLGINSQDLGVPVELSFKRDVLDAGVTFSAKLLSSTNLGNLPNEFIYYRFVAEGFEIFANGLNGNCEFKTVIDVNAKKKFTTHYKDYLLKKMLIDSAGAPLQVYITGLDGITAHVFSFEVSDFGNDYIQDLDSIEHLNNLYKNINFREDSEFSLSEVFSQRLILAVINQIYKPVVEKVTVNVKLDSPNKISPLKEYCVLKVVLISIGGYFHGVWVSFIGDGFISENDDVEVNVSKIKVLDNFTFRGDLKGLKEIIQDKTVTKASEIEGFNLIVDLEL